MKHALLILLLLPALAYGQLENELARYPIDDASVSNLNDGIIGRWKFQEDTNKNNFYEIIRHEPYAMHRYHIKFWDRGGKNPTYESNLHFSKIGDALFINVPYVTRGDFNVRYFFLKVLDVDPGFTKMTVAVVHDTTMMNLSQGALQRRIEKNVDNPAYYSDAVHLYKMK